MKPLYTTKEMYLLVKREECGSVKNPLKTWYFIAMGLAALIVFAGFGAVVTMTQLRKRSLNRALTRLETQSQMYGHVVQSSPRAIVKK